MMLLLLACLGASPDEVHTDGVPGAVTEGPGGWTAEVAPGGQLVIASPSGEHTPLPGRSLAEVAFSADGARFAYARGVPETDLVVLPLPPDGSERVVATRADRPVFSPDGSQLAFVSGRTGIASVYVVELDGPHLRARQVTNIGLEQLPREPGQPPEGFVPPPHEAMEWTDGGLAWEADGRTWQVELP